MSVELWAEHSVHLGAVSQPCGLKRCEDVKRGDNVGESEGKISSPKLFGFRARDSASAHVSNGHKESAGFPNKMGIL